MVHYAAEFFNFSLGVSIEFDVPCRGSLGILGGVRLRTGKLDNFGSRPR